MCKRSYKTIYENYSKTVASVNALSNYMFDGFSPVAPSTNPLPDILINVTDFNYDTDNLHRIDSWFYGREKYNLLYFNDIFVGFDNKILLHDLYGEVVQIKVNPSTLLLDHVYAPRSRQSITKLINDVITVRLLLRDIIMIHAACLEKPDGNAILLAGYPNIGKTLATLQLLKRGFKYLSDDVILIDAHKTAYLNSFASAVGYNDFLKYISPSDIGYKTYFRFYLRGFPMAKSKIFNRLIRPPLLTLSDIKSFNVSLKTPVDTVCILENGRNSITALTPSQAFTKLKYINEYCIGDVKNPLIQAYRYFNPEPDLKELSDTILWSVVTDLPCYSLSCNDFQWESLMNEIL